MRKLLFLFIFGLSVIAFSDGYRSFTDSQGRTIKAKIIEVDKRAKKVTLERDNKKKVTVSISIFSEADQEYINAWAPSSEAEKTETTNSEPIPTALSKSDIKVIAGRYIDACNSLDYDSVESLFHKSIRSSKGAFDSYYKRTTSSRLEKLRLGVIGANFFQIKATYNSSGQIKGSTRSIWVLLTPDGKIKYDSFIRPHPIEDINTRVAQFDRISNGSPKDLVGILKRNEIPLFGLPAANDDDAEKDALKEIIDWLLDNGTKFDTSDPKVFYPKKAFGSIEEDLKLARKKL